MFNTLLSLAAAAVVDLALGILAAAAVVAVSLAR
jgi:hypothetical protein